MRYLSILIFFLISKGFLQAQACTITVSNPTVAICIGSSAVVTASINNPGFEGTVSYSWSTGATTASASLNPTTTTVYTVTGVAGSCTLSTTATVTVKPKPTLVISPSSPTVCFSSALTLTVTGASTYTWNTGATTSTISVTPTINTTYTATGTGTNACINSIVKTVTVNPNLVLTNSTPTICMGSSAALVASGATTYSWSTGATTTSISVSPTVATTYTVRGTTGSCSRTLSATVTPIALPNTNISVSTSQVCSGGAATLTAGGATTYTWSTGATTTSVAVSPTIATIYTVTGSSNSCIKAITTTITVGTACNYNGYGYKTKWTNFVATKFRNDTISTNRTNSFTTGFSFPYATSKNTLKANNNGWAEVLITSSTDYLVLGFHDSTSVNNSGYLDIDFGFSKNLNNTYLWRAGTSSGITACTTGDLVRIEKVGNIFYYKINGVTQYTMNIPITKDLKLKLAINTNAIANIGASFIDSTNSNFPNYVQDIPIIKHCSPGLQNGSISLTSKIAGASQTFTWAVNSSTASSINGLGPANYKVDVKDANLNSSKQNYNVGYKTRWTNFFGTKFRNDSLLISNALISWPSAVSKNTLKRNTDGWAEMVLQPTTDFVMLGFHDSTSVTNHGYSDIDYGFYKNNGSFYAVISGTFVTIGNPVIGDVIRIERVGSVFNLKRNGFVVHTATVSTSKNWKLKAALNTNAVCNIGASFIDTTAIDFPNYVRSLPVIKHVNGLNASDGSIKLLPKYSDFGRTYTWTPLGENNSIINNKIFGQYNVIVVDTFQNSSTLKYDILYKTKWTSATNSILRNDSVLVTNGYLGYASAVSKNILKANQDGKVSWTVDKFASNRMVGFADVTSTVSGVWSDIDYGIYETQGKVYYLSGGSFTNTGLYYEAGDVLKLERVSNVIKCYLNGIQVYSITAANTNVDWKVKTTITASNSISNVGCSFNTNFNIGIDKEHADYSTPNNGSASIISYSGITPYKVIWDDSTSGFSRTDLYPGKRSVLAYADSTSDSEVAVNVFTIGTKPLWQLKINGDSDDESVWNNNNDSLGALVSTNMIEKTVSGEFELKATDTNQDMAFGFFGSTMNVTFYNQAKTDSVLTKKMNLGYAVVKDAVDNHLIYSGGRLSLNSDYSDIHLMRIHNGQIQLLLAGVNLVNSIYSYSAGDFIKIGRSAADGKIFIARNDTILYRHNIVTDQQYFHSAIITANVSRVVKKGIVIPGDDVVLLPPPVKEYCVLKRKLDGGFHTTSNNQLLIISEGEYNTSNLKFNIYNKTHLVTISNATIGSNINSNIQALGDNRYILTFPSLASGYYTLEVINEKNEKQYLRFYHKPLCTNCN